MTGDRAAWTLQAEPETPWAGGIAILLEVSSRHLFPDDRRNVGQLLHPVPRPAHVASREHGRVRVPPRRAALRACGLSRERLLVRGEDRGGGHVLGAEQLRPGAFSRPGSPTWELESVKGFHRSWRAVEMRLGF